jgi:probable HAF family extracellular repeat protein
MISPRRLAVVGISTVALFAGLAFSATASPRRYSVTVLSTLGGDFANAGGLNNSGAVAGEATLPGQDVFSPQGLDHAFLWHRGAIIDLGTLGGPNSYVQPDYPVNDSGIVAGYSQTSTPDPNGEDICDLIQGRAPPVRRHTPCCGGTASRSTSARSAARTATLPSTSTTADR